MAKQIYSGWKREKEEHKLPNVYVFFYTEYNNSVKCLGHDLEPGYYFWRGDHFAHYLHPCDCFPGCMPDSEPWGPYGTEQEAIKAAQ